MAWEVTYSRQLQPGPIQHGQFAIGSIVPPKLWLPTSATAVSNLTGGTVPAFIPVGATDGTTFSAAAGDLYDDLGRLVPPFTDFPTTFLP